MVTSDRPQDAAPTLELPKRRPERASVLVSTYRQPRELDLALAALCRQSRAPHEVLIGDDGSGDRTRDVIEHWRAKCSFPIEHIWQVDRGFRKSRVMNEAARRSTGDHLIFLDGDAFPHRHWVADHMQAADGRTVLCGRRVRLGPRLSPTVTRDDIEAGRFDSAFSPLLLKSSLSGDTRRLPLGVRLPQPVARIFHPKPRRLMGVNFSLPRAAYEFVNGLDEAYEAYGHEDHDLGVRLKRAGVRQAPILNRAVVFHLYHDERPWPEETRRLIEATERSKRVRCSIGYAQVGTFDPAT